MSKIRSVGKFVEISPSANLLGRCKIGDFTEVGSNSTILPDIVIGANVVVAAGAVVTKNVEEGVVVVAVEHVGRPSEEGEVVPREKRLEVCDGAHGDVPVRCSVG